MQVIIGILLLALGFILGSIMMHTTERINILEDKQGMILHHLEGAGLK